MNRFTSALAIAAAMLVSPIIMAGDDFNAQFAERMEQAAERLELTDEQLDQMRPLIEQTIEEQKRVLHSYGISEELAGDAAGMLSFREARSLRRALDAVRNEAMDDLELILTEAQLDEVTAIWDERRDEMRAKLKARR